MNALKSTGAVLAGFPVVVLSVGTEAALESMGVFPNPGRGRAGRHPSGHGVEWQDDGQT